MGIRNYFACAGKGQFDLNLSERKIGELFNEACALFDEDQTDKYIRKSTEAYFIGIVDNVLNTNVTINTTKNIAMAYIALLINNF